ncbi:EscU/YscU/HrcU family type III secretion system export apparatus switch protein [Alkaliphilus transvaalensis]|uniref:EscU/YscU/HrcU family type III secretion system export apparatus switch protein n=1 Tax=Alkaliphilus transvaalensis TaxID=114628 RepID=UPI000478909F|nr:EscU/YscU/HrcU family type III secretion system export apparatus switch protein [Alkaliphilus transvaalensis]
MEHKEIKQAVALSYDMEKDQVPVITAVGRGIVAEKIMEKAEEKEIPIHHNEKLVKELIQLKVGTEIPQELYEIVAQVLIFVEELDRKKTG